jgi:hypothetical protein
MVTPKPSWSLVLQGIIKSTTERQRLASTLGVTYMTLSRWASGESKPQKNHLIRLVQAVHPNQRQALLDALEIYYPDIHNWLTEDGSDQIPPDFFAQVLNIRTTTTESLLFWRITDVVLKQALAHLDPHHLGMAIKVLQCMPPSRGDLVRSLRERVGKGTHPWTADLEHHVFFLGQESLSGDALEKVMMKYLDDVRKPSPSPSARDEYEISAAVCPICFEGSVAGCLLASSSEPSYFTPRRRNLLTVYSNLVALAFRKEEFYPRSLIQLMVMPKQEAQREYIATFRSRVTAKLQQAMYQQQSMSNAAIELQAWQEIENELFNLPDDAYPMSYGT